MKPVPDSACGVACPADVNVKAYVGLIAARRFDRALQVVIERNPLPGICGRVCTHPCESECRRGEIDAPVAIRPLKRFIADYALDAAPTRLPAETPKRRERIAIVGAGPAGITAANDLARSGYRVTVFEALTRPGGMLRVGIPRFRLPHDVIDHEIESVAAIGVKIETNSRIDDPTGLLKDRFSAVFCAIGAHAGIGLGLDLEDELQGVVDCTDFLRSANLGQAKPLSGRVLVIGGGNSAIDSARVARRLGARDVRILYRRTRKEMPADVAEIDEALAEHVKIEFGVQPVALLHDADRVSGVRCIRTRPGPPDASGRRRPVPMPGSEFDVPTRLVIKAIGQRPDTEHLADSEIPLTRRGTILADPDTCSTDIPGLFAGGDVTTGPSTVIDAIAAGHHAARSIRAFVTGRDVWQDRAPGTGRTETELELPDLVAVAADRVKPRVLSNRTRRNFKEVELTLTETEATAEAGRCLRCGPCDECVRCHALCPRRQVALVLPGSDDEILVRVPTLDSVFTDAAGPRPVTVRRAGAKPVKMEAVVVQGRVDRELCRGCGQCRDACLHEAIRMVEWHDGLQAAEVDPARCRGCGTCLTVCPTGALSDYRGGRS